MKERVIGYKETVLRSVSLFRSCTNSRRMRFKIISPVSRTHSNIPWIMKIWVGGPVLSALVVSG